MNPYKSGFDQQGSGPGSGARLAGGQYDETHDLGRDILLGTTLAAQADNDTYVDNTRHGRGNDALDADVSSCAQPLGMPQNGQPTSRQFKQCMLGLGWKWKYTTVSRTPKPAPNRADDDSWTFDGCTFNPSSSSGCQKLGSPTVG